MRLKELRALAESCGATPTDSRDPNAKVVMQMTLAELEKFAQNFIPKITKDAAKLTEEIKALVREKPTALNAYGLKSWEKIERMMVVALTAVKTAPSVEQDERMAHDLTLMRNAFRVTETEGDPDPGKQ